MQLGKRGVLLINLGTPDDPSVASVRRYLNQFLSDERVIELPWILRFLLVKCIIVPFRSKKSARAYAKIWQEDGSPLLVNSLALQQELQKTMGSDYYVALGMRYGKPSIEQALLDLQLHAVQDITLIPLFPQYSSAANGSAIAEALRVLAKNKIIVPLRVISEFYQHPAYVQALADSVKPYLTQAHDYILMSYHGLPEQQLINPGVNCYKTQCLRTSKLLAEKLNLDPNRYTTSFQSRLGRLPWIKPYTDEVLIELRAQGIKNLLVCCPSFVADCLETLEEIGMAAREQWQELGGESLQLIPCLNAQPQWAAALASILEK